MRTRLRRTGMPAVYIALASAHYSQRVPHPSDNTLTRYFGCCTYEKGKSEKDGLWWQERRASYGRPSL
eukprot:5850577-Pleurochrysis_carterae.AAC.1